MLAKQHARSFDSSALQESGRAHADDLTEQLSKVHLAGDCLSPSGLLWVIFLDELWRGTANALRLRSVNRVATLQVDALRFRSPR